MRYPKNGFRALALSFLAILSLMAFMAAGAQAEWKLEGKALAADESLTSSSVTEGMIKVPALELQISCGSLTTDKGTILKATGDWHFEGHLWSSCTTAKAGKTLTGCKPVEPIVANLQGQPILESNLTYMISQFEPAAVVEFNSETCSLPSKNTLSGDFVSECLTEKLTTGEKLCETEMATHFLQPAPEKLFPEIQVTFGKSPASITGIVAWKLSGKNAGKKWSGGI